MKEEQELNQNEEQSKKKNYTTIIILSIIIVMLIGVILFLLLNKNENKKVNNDTKNNKENIQVNNIEINDEIIKKIKSIGGMDEENEAGIFGMFLYNPGEVINLGDSQKGQIIYEYALKNNMLTEKNVQESGLCNVLSKEDYEKIISIYDFGEFKTTWITESNDEYMFCDGGDFIYYNVTHNISTKTDGNMITVTDTAELKSPEETLTKEFTYTFEVNNNSYKLMSVYVK